jgi:hypothetical protein
MAKGLKDESLLNGDQFDLEDYKCTKCKLNMIGPVKCNDCYSHFCYACFKECELEGRCPVNQQPLKRGSLGKPDEDIADLEYELKVKCPNNSSHGTMTLKEYAKHVTNCGLRKDLPKKKSILKWYTKPELEKTPITKH